MGITDAVYFKRKLNRMYPGSKEITSFTSGRAPEYTMQLYEMMRGRGDEQPADHRP